MTTEMKEKYAELRKQQKELLAVLNPANLGLKAHQKKIAAAKEANDQELIKELRKQFRPMKDAQKELCYRLVELNAAMREIRNQESGKVELSPEKAAKKQQKEAEKAAKKEERKRIQAEKVATRESKKPSKKKKLWNFDFFSKKEQKMMNHMHQIFAKTHQERMGGN